MSWADYWAPNLVQWILGAAISAVVGLYVRRVVRTRAAEVDRLVRTVEGLLGATVTDTPQEPRMDLTRYRKGIAAGFGVMFTGLLTWAETANLEPVIGPLVPEPFRPLVGVVLGGIALTASVILAPNAPAPGPRRAPVDPELAAHYGSPDAIPSEPAPTIEPPAPTADQPALAPSTAGSSGTASTAAAVVSPPASLAAAAAARPESTRGPFWAGTPAGEPQAETALVELLPEPGRSSYQ